MSEAVEKLRPVLESLNKGERSELIELLSRLDEEQFVAELRRRRDEYESGAVKGIPAEEVFAGLKAKYE